MTRLYRSERDKKIFGLCGGLAESFRVDATILRLIVIIAAFFSGGTVIFLYLIASMVIPKEQDVFDRRNRYDDYPPSYDSNPNSTSSSFKQEEKKDDIDRMMEDIEKKAMWREIEELREKLKKFEDKEKGENKDERI